MSDAERNKEVVRRLYEEVINEGRFEVLADIIAPDAVDNASGTAARSGGGSADFHAHVTWMREVVRDVRTTVTDILAEGDRVVVFWRIEGIHDGPLFGLPGTGRPLLGHSISWITLREGRIAEYNVLPDRLGILEHLGAAVAV